MSARRHPAAALSAAAALLLASCNFAPRDVRPPAPIADHYPDQPATPDAADAGAASATGIGYAEYFPDPRLQALIARGLEHNRDLAVAVAQIAEAGALYRVQRGDLLPEVAASASVSHARGQLPGSPLPVTATQQQVAVGIPGFELDFWGRVRNLTAAARNRYLATVAGARAARLALIRSIATGYWTLLEADERVALAQSTVDSRAEGLHIADRRLEAGVTSALDFRQAESLLTQAQTELAALHQARAEARNLLTVLVGGPIPDDLAPPLALAQQRPTRQLAPGTPSQLLEARPDIAAAEAQLRAARADVGAARAAFFPNIALIGSLGYASTDLDQLFDGDSFNWSVGPSLNLPIFNWGKRKGNLDVAKARTDIAVATYEKTVQTAFREVADALAGQRYLADEVAAQAHAADTQREIARLAAIRYREGVAEYLEVLDAERNLFTAEQQLLSLQRRELSNLAGLYAALGGGLGGEPASP